MAIMDKTMLRSDGDTLELRDGRTLRLRVTPDEFYGIDDELDYLGRVEWVRSNDYGSVRPDWANGNAEVIDRGYYQRLWWQPPSDVVRGTDEFKNLRRLVMDTLTYGYSVYTLEVCEGRDAYGQRIVVNMESLGGVAPIWDATYVDSIVHDLATNLGVEL